MWQTYFDKLCAICYLDLLDVHLQTTYLGYSVN